MYNNARILQSAIICKQAYPAPKNKTEGGIFNLAHCPNMHFLNGLPGTNFVKTSSLLYISGQTHLKFFIPTN